MSARVAAGWALSRFQSVSVVPMIQCLPQGMTKRTDFLVFRISPVVDRIRSRGTRIWMPLLALKWNWPRSPTMAWVSSVQTPVALTIWRAWISNSRPVSVSRARTIVKALKVRILHLPPRASVWSGCDRVKPAVYGRS